MNIVSFKNQESPCIMCVQYIKVCLVDQRDTKSTLEGGGVLSSSMGYHLSFKSGGRSRVHWGRLKLMTLPI